MQILDTADGPKVSTTRLMIFSGVLRHHHRAQHLGRITRVQKERHYASQGGVEITDNNTVAPYTYYPNDDDPGQHFRPGL